MEVKLVLGLASKGFEHFVQNCPNNIHTLVRQDLTLTTEDTSTTYSFSTHALALRFNPPLHDSSLILAFNALKKVDNTHSLVFGIPLVHGQSPYLTNVRPVLSFNNVPIALRLTLAKQCFADDVVQAQLLESGTHIAITLNPAKVGSGLAFGLASFILGAFTPQTFGMTFSYTNLSTQAFAAQQSQQKKQRTYYNLQRQKQKDEMQKGHRDGKGVHVGGVSSDSFVQVLHNGTLLHHPENTVFYPTCRNRVLLRERIMEQQGSGELNIPQLPLNWLGSTKLLGQQHKWKGEQPRQTTRIDDYDQVQQHINVEDLVAGQGSQPLRTVGSGRLLEVGQLVQKQRDPISVNSTPGQVVQTVKQDIFAQFQRGQHGNDKVDNVMGSTPHIQSPPVTSTTDAALSKKQRRNSKGGLHGFVVQTGQTSTTQQPPAQVQFTPEPVTTAHAVDFGWKGLPAAPFDTQYKQGALESKKSGEQGEGRKRSKHELQTNQEGSDVNVGKVECEVGNVSTDEDKSMSKEPSRLSSAVAPSQQLHVVDGAPIYGEATINRLSDSSAEYRRNETTVAQCYPPNSASPAVEFGDQLRVSASDDQLAKVVQQQVPLGQSRQQVDLGHEQVTQAQNVAQEQAIKQVGSRINDLNCLARRMQEQWYHVRRQEVADAKGGSGLAGQRCLDGYAAEHPTTIPIDSQAEVEQRQTDRFNIQMQRERLESSMNKSSGDDDTYLSRSTSKVVVDHPDNNDNNDSNNNKLSDICAEVEKHDDVVSLNLSGNCTVGSSKVGGVYRKEDTENLAIQKHVQNYDDKGQDGGNRQA